MSDGIANIIQYCSKLALEVQPDGKNTIEVIHDIVIND
jgi:hypothetical protein